MFRRSSLTANISTAPTRQIFVKVDIWILFTNICGENSHLIEIRKKIFRALNIKTRVCFVLLAATYCYRPFLPVQRP